ncbi:MAG: prenyltransferase/squalene oxidase repeat-containing protein [Anaerolineae bacterium]
MIPFDFIIASQNPDGGWGYKRDGMSYVEPTAAVLLALRETYDSSSSAYSRGLAFLRQLQHKDGGWGIGALDDESGWMTAWAVWALAVEDQAAAARGADWLFQVDVLRTTDPAELEGIRRVLKIDASLRGWPWQLHDASWTFPTGLALLSLHALGRGSHPRVEEGIRFLLDRVIPSGGWNVGNPSMLGAELPATVINTGLVLLALRTLGVSNDSVAHGYVWLAARLPQARTGPELAWGVWGLRGSPDNLGDAQTRLESLERPDGSWDGNPYTTAIAMLGLK